MSDFSDVAQELRTRFGEFLETDVNPGAAERDERALPFSRDLLRRLTDIGLLNFFIPKEIGGGGESTVRWGVLLEQVGYVCEDGSLPLVLGLFAAVTRAICDTKRPDLIERFARPMASGERFGSFAYSDGADPFAFKSTVKRTRDGYLLDGEKLLVTGAAVADTFMVYLRNEVNDLQVFLVERTDPGVTVVPIEVAGMRSAGLASLKMQGTLVPSDRLMVEADGLGHALKFLNERRVLLACGPLGRMQAIYEDLIDELRSTVRYTKPLTAMPNVQSALGKLYVTIESSRALCYRALERVDLGMADPVFDPITSAAKYCVTDHSVRLAIEAMRLLGGGGYLKTRKYERYLRDFCGMLAGGGTQDILEMDFAQRAVSDAEQRSRNGVTRRSSARWRSS